MAKNVQWALENEGHEGRLLVFAHNGHVWNYQWPGSRTSRFKEPVPMMGVHLRRMYEDDLYIISTSSVVTSGDLERPTPIEDSIDDALARVGLSKMFLDLRMARRDPAAFAWLSQPRPLNANLGHYDVIAPSNTLDAFVFLRELTPAGEIPGSH
jgi:erythromycin esterase